MILIGSFAYSVPLIDDVVQPTADQRRDRDDDDPVADEVGILAGLAGRAVTRTRYATARPIA